MSIYVILEYIESHCKSIGENPTFEGLKRYKDKYWR